MLKFDCFYLCVFLVSAFFITANGAFSTFHFEVEPIDTIVIKGSSTVLDCSVSGSPSPLIQWKREGVDVELDNRRHVLENGSLYFEKVYLSRTGRPDEGLYQCLASRNAIGTIISRSAKLQIASLPKFDTQPGDLSLLTGQTAYFPCSVHAVPPAVVTWLKDDHPLSLDDSRMTVLPSGALEIDFTTKTDVATYRCNASNLDKFRLSDTGRLMVDGNFDTTNLRSAPQFVTTPSKLTNIVEGESLTLDCVANGNPKPKIVWLKDGSTIDMADLDSKFRIVGSGSLLVEKIQENDSGTYMCRAENSEDSVDSQANVVVHVPPRFKKKPENKLAYERDDIEFECEVYGQPLPTVQWYKNGILLIGSDYYQYVKDNLRILGVDMSDTGMYQCVASNQAGNIQSSLELVVKNPESASLTTLSSSAIASSHPDLIGPFNVRGTPSAPFDIVAVVTGSRFVTLKWSAPIQSNGNILAYSVFYREATSKRERTINSTRGMEEINIQGLSPSSKYIFRVVAYNQHGPGQFSDNLALVTGSEINVPGLPLKLEVRVLSGTSVLVRWKPPKEDSNPIHQYTVRYMEEGSSKEIETSTSNTSVIISDLHMFTEYTIWVMAANKYGTGQSTKEVSVRTFSDVPSDTPQNVTLEAASSNGIIIRWEPPPREFQNGIITGYKIRHKTKGRKSYTVTTDGDRRLYVLSGLERGATYSIKISALTSNGSGPATDWMTTETYIKDLNESKVPDQPGAIRTRPSSNYIAVNWEPPRDTNIMVRGYTIGWGVGFPDVYKEVLDGKQRYYTISNLNPSLEYVISLTAYNKYGSGKPIYDTVKTLAESTPEPYASMMPPVGLEAIVLSSTTVVLYWTDSTLPHSQIIPDNRIYTVRFSTMSKHKYFNSSDMNCIVNDLKPNTQYEFAVKVVKGRRESTWSMSVFNTTQEAVPSSPPRDLTIVPSEDDNTIMNLHWQPPKQPNGNILGYVISYSMVPPQKNVAVEDRKWTLEDSHGDKLTSVLKSLSLNTVYYCKIQAKNIKGYGPFSSEISFQTSPETKSSNETMYIIIACVAGVTLMIIIIIIIVVCKRGKNLSTRSKNYSKGTLAKNKAMGKELVPPDLWIHHDQMELKPVDKTSCAENNMTVTPIQRNSQELGEEPLLSCIEKKKSAYLASTVPLPSGNPGCSSDGGGNTLTRPMYPRTQYNISRSHNSGEICHTGSIVDVTTVPLNVHASGPYEPVTSNEKCQAFPPASESSSGTLTKRPPGHPLRSFTVPAPPPQSAPATPQPKHLDVCAPKVSLPLTSVLPSHSQQPGTVLPSHSQKPSTVLPTKSQAEGSSANKITAAASVHVSWSTEKLNQEVANLEGLVKDLNAIRASEFEC